MRLCQCGADLTGRHGNTKFCHECSAERPKSVYEVNRRAKMPRYQSCNGCNATFEPKLSPWCSPQCAGKYNRAKQLGKFRKTCIACGEQFTAQDNRKLACSIACYMWHGKHPDKQRVLARECRHCQQPFIANNANRYHCTEQCAKAASKVRRRGKLSAAYVEDVSKGVVAKRDGWKCQLCGGPVSGKHKWPHPLSWSLDHIVPIYHGGEHSYANTQLAHLGCNVAKGHKLQDATQLVLTV